MTEQFILVAYDISDDRRRTKLHNALLDYGTPVQYSVFECLLDEAREKAMRRTAKRIARAKLDSVRFYYLCAACQKRIETNRGPEPAGDLPAAVVVG